MRTGVAMSGAVGLAVVMVSSGCVSLDKYNRLSQAHRRVTADKEQLAQELQDERDVNDNLRTKVGALEREMGAKDELVGNLRGENELLDQMRRMTQSELERAANRMGSITIEGPKLPGPLDTALKRFAEEHPAEVEYDPARGTVKWKADLIFALGSDVVKDSSMAALRGFTDILQSIDATDFEVLVVGHTDTRPIQRPETKAKHPTNWHLSTHRAIAVGNVLQKFGYSPTRIGVVGCGEFRPVADNASESGASLNRRVEIYLVPTGSIMAAADDRARRPGTRNSIPDPAAPPRPTIGDDHEG